MPWLLIFVGVLRRVAKRYPFVRAGPQRMSTRSRSVTARRTFWCAVESGRFVRVVLVIFVCSPNTSRVLAGRTRRFSSPWLIRALVSAFLLHLVVSHASKIFAFPTTTVDAYSANEVSIDETIRSHPLFLFFLQKMCLLLRFLLRGLLLTFWSTKSHRAAQLLIDSFSSSAEEKDWMSPE